MWLSLKIAPCVPIQQSHLFQQHATERRAVQPQASLVAGIGVEMRVLRSELLDKFVARLQEEEIDSVNY